MEVLTSCCLAASDMLGTQVGWTHGSSHMRSNAEEQPLYVRHLLDVFAVLGLCAAAALLLAAWACLRLMRWCTAWVFSSSKGSRKVSNGRKQAQAQVLAS